jgi:hypothetical protein
MASPRFGNLELCRRRRREALGGTHTRTHPFCHQIVTNTQVIVMRGSLTLTLAAGIAALAFAGAQPAAATPAGAAIAYGESNAGVVEHVGRRDRYVRRWNRGPYYRGYPGYAYRPYYRPYAYYDYGYPYWGRGPGLSFWFGF